jgi:hypothetical protein
MAHFAELDAANVVTRVVVVANNELMNGSEESEAKGIAFLAGLYGHSRWVQTSYNCRIRKNYAGSLFTFDPARDAFVPPRPFPSWLLDEETCQWEPPVPRPVTPGDWVWDEDSVQWVNNG